MEGKQTTRGKLRSEWFSDNWSERWSEFAWVGDGGGGQALECQLTKAEAAAAAAKAPCSFVYSSFHNLAFVRNTIHQRQQSGCFLWAVGSPFGPVTPPPYKPTITHWYGWTIFVICYWPRVCRLIFLLRQASFMMC